MTSIVDSISSSVKTPRLRVEIRGEIIEKWLNIIQNIFFSYLCQISERRYLVEIYINHLQNRDSQFLISTSKKLERLNSKKKVKSEKTIRAHYLGIKTRKLNEEFIEPLWLQKLLYRNYSTLGELDKVKRDNFKDEIFSLTDLDIIYINIRSGGGRDRTPTGSFTEGANQFFTKYLSESLKIEDQIFLTILNTFATINNAHGSLKIYQEKRGRSLSVESDLLMTPSFILDKIENLEKDIFNFSSDDSSTKSGVVDDLADMANIIERFVKDMGISIIKLTEFLSIFKRQMIAQVWQELSQIFSDKYEHHLKKAFKSINNYLLSDVQHVKDDFSSLVDYIDNIEQSSSEVKLAIKILKDSLLLPTKLFGLEESKEYLVNFENDLRSIFQRIIDNCLKFENVKSLSNHLDEVMSRLENISHLIDNRKGDKFLLGDFMIFMEKWKKFYNFMDVMEKKIMINYTFEYNLHRAWMFIEKINK